MPLNGRFSLSDLMNQSLSTIIGTSLSCLVVVSTRPLPLKLANYIRLICESRKTSRRAMKISVASDEESYWGLPTCYTCVAVHIGREINFDLVIRRFREKHVSRKIYAFERGKWRLKTSRLISGIVSWLSDGENLKWKLELWVLST